MPKRLKTFLFSSNRKQIQSSSPFPQSSSCTFVLEDKKNELSFLKTIDYMIEAL
ncbi:hypothetical protein RO3G_00418 [Rhizopus delemar RA 99-880]|uniref:Uncharacterized protein n=1 Tax=Rhizopus delemar (strain RA 99-880 / ATCC MYA-4621 / FGSC 9543 / NRRL 43880) TaxID=246409 RepID=I1BHN4_RHIO9|nr:hypothetical protein RO3G_00418 [Rhizopus delemar RA 99-880]|eukprot:EIE75714.1 hypothetical protein RO3G_00418 [Rhizopus delemar RA 99-880]